MIVAGDQQHAAILGRAGVVCLFEYVAATVDTRPLAVPHGENAVPLGLGKQVQLLRAPDGCRRQVFVDARMESDVVLAQELPGVAQRRVEAGQGRTAVAGYVARGVEPRSDIALV